MNPVKLYKEITRPAQRVTVGDGVVCDICKRKFSDDWNATGYQVLESEVSLRAGSSYPEGGIGENIEFDICPDCFRDKLVPFLRSLGASPTVEAWNTF
jgi:hypothetical protein